MTDLYKDLFIDKGKGKVEPGCIYYHENSNQYCMLVSNISGNEFNLVNLETGIIVKSLKGVKYITAITDHKAIGNVCAIFKGKPTKNCNVIKVFCRKR